MAAVRRALIVLAVLGVLPAAACTQSSDAGLKPSAEQVPRSDSEQAIVVTVVLPGTGHAEPVVGRVTTIDDTVVASFVFPASFEFLEEPSVENEWRVPTSWIDESGSLEVSLPAPGTYIFGIGDVFYWGGCGTCGQIYGGGEVVVAVEEGSVVELDRGIVTGAT